MELLFHGLLAGALNTYETRQATLDTLIAHLVTFLRTRPATLTILAEQTVLTNITLVLARLKFFLDNLLAGSLQTSQAGQATLDALVTHFVALLRPRPSTFTVLTEKTVLADVALALTRLEFLLNNLLANTLHTV